MDKREQNLSFGKVLERTDGATPVFSEPQAPDYAVDDHYLAFYRVLHPSGKHDAVLARASCVIGSPMAVVLEGEPHLETLHGEYIAPLPLEDSALLLGAHEQGWETRTFITQVVYSDEERLLWGEFAIFAYDPALPGLAAFVDAIVGRIAHGEHPTLSLKQGEFQRVLDSKGAWYLTKECPRPELKAGEASFKKRRGLADTLVAAANQNKIGCEAAAIVFWLAVIGLIVKLIFF